MMVKKSIYTFAKTCNIYFFVKSNLFVYIYSGIYIILKIFSTLYLKININLFSIIFINRCNFISFIKFNLLNYSKFFCLYFFKLRLKGLGYRIVRICKNLYRFYFVMVNYFYLHLPSSVFIKYKSRRLILYSFNLQILRVVFVNILLLCKQFIYFIRGLVYPRQIIVLKPGKKRL